MERQNSVSLQTKQALAAALKRLMAQKPVEKITIQELAELCGMKRQNFYYHFEDIYDLMRWMFQEEAMSLLQKREGALLWQEGILQLFQYLEDNRAVCLCAMRSLGRDGIKRLFSGEIYSIIQGTIVQMADEIGYGEENVPPGWIELLTHYFVVSLAGMMESWLLGEVEQSPRELVDFCDMALNDFMRGAAMRLDEKGYWVNHNDC